MCLGAAGLCSESRSMDGAQTTLRDKERQELTERQIVKNKTESASITYGEVLTDLLNLMRSQVNVSVRDESEYR